MTGGDCSFIVAPLLRNLGLRRSMSPVLFLRIRRTISFFADASPVWGIGQQSLGEQKLANANT